MKPKKAPVAKGKRTKKTGSQKKEKRLSALDAAAEVLHKSSQPMRCTELIAAMADQGLWKSPVGKTPAATLSAAIQREIAKKGKEARFKKAERGKFAFNDKI